MNAVDPYSDLTWWGCKTQSHCFPRVNGQTQGKSLCGARLRAEMTRYTATGELWPRCAKCAKAWSEQGKRPKTKERNDE